MEGKCCAKGQQVMNWFSSSHRESGTYQLLSITLAWCSSKTADDNLKYSKMTDCAKVKTLNLQCLGS